MKVRNGFVSNSSSCSFMLVLPENRSILEGKRSFWEWFGLENTTQEEKEVIHRAVNKILEKRSQKDNLYLVLEYLGNLVNSLRWIKYQAEDPRDSSYSLRDYEEYKQTLEELVEAFKRNNDGILFMEVGNSCEYEGTDIGNSFLEEDLSLEDRAKKIFTKNSFVFNNR